MEILHVNGALVRADQAFISVDDRGFRFGDGIFESIAVHTGKPYLLQYHIDRLREGLTALEFPCDLSSMASHVEKLISVNATKQGLVRISISRGVGSRGYLPSLPVLEPTVVIQILPLPAPPAGPISLWLSQWEKPSLRALPVNCKLAQGVNSSLARMEAQKHDCYEALQLNANLHVCEASSANIFWVCEGIIYTPSLTTGALAGVTRRRLMDLAPAPITQSECGIETLLQAEEVFLTNSAMGVMSVNRLMPINHTWNNFSCAQQFSSMRLLDIQQLCSTAQKNLP